VALKMTGFSHLVRFQCEEDKSSCFADLGTDANGPPSRGTLLEAYKSVQDLVHKKDPKNVTVSEVRPFFSIHVYSLIPDNCLQILAPLPQDGVPIYCVGLNYHSHAKEAGVRIPKNQLCKRLICSHTEPPQLSVPSYPPLWTKPAASLAKPGEAIPVNDFCAKSLLDYEVRAGRKVKL
jgi:2-keto-4-pentenoate hydratase/2-oxohepta-3-ene-1,7-dioic acid hydratase in catechol pathway